MITKQQKINTIYDKIANKELSFGCRIFHKVDGKRGFEARIITGAGQYKDGIFYGVVLNPENSVIWIQENEIEIIGHPVMIGDVMDYFGIKVFPINFHQALYGVDSEAEILELWKEKRKPIEDQSELCIDFIYNMVY